MTASDMKQKTREKIRTRVEQKLRPLTLPNFITLMRMAMVPFFVIAVSEKDFRLALWIFVVAGLTDALDGFLARRMDMHSMIGAYLGVNPSLTITALSEHICSRIPAKTA